MTSGSGVNSWRRLVTGSVTGGALAFGLLAGAGHDILKLRQQGYKPSNANREAITEALDKRPNQVPLIKALKSTLAYQRKLQAQASAQIQQPGMINPGVGQFPAGIAPIPGGGAQPGPSGGIQIPLG
nr:hypothetical protein [Mycolicibacterium houstonense]